MLNEPWYAAQCVFRHAGTEHGPKQTYEERITLLRAGSFDEAIERAEKEAEEYSRDLEGCEYLGCVDVFHIYDETVGDGTEIFSSMRRADSEPKEYLDLHYPRVSDDCEAIGESHRWHNLDGNRSACYHCKVIREGQQWTAKRNRRN